jgi:hypothetical protein
MVNIVTFVLLKGVRFCFGDSVKNNKRGARFTNFFLLIYIFVRCRVKGDITEVARIA